MYIYYICIYITVYKIHKYIYIYIYINITVYKTTFNINHCTILFNIYHTKFVVYITPQNIKDAIYICIYK